MVVALPVVRIRPSDISFYSSTYVTTHKGFALRPQLCRYHNCNFFGLVGVDS
jgi:hypothetical protein